MSQRQAITFLGVKHVALDQKMLERYMLYAQKGDRLSLGQVHHSPYPLREARLRTCEQSWLDDIGLTVQRPPDHVLFSDGVATEIFPLHPIITSPPS